MRTSHRGITIEMFNNEYEFEGFYQKEQIKGYTNSEDKAKRIIDETISFITEYQENSSYNSTAEHYTVLQKSKNKGYFDLEY